MNVRILLSINLLIIAIILLILPERVSKKGQPLPSEEIQLLDQNLASIDVDKAAMIINQSDSGYQLIDVRPADEFLAFNLPGSINIPFDQLLAPQWQGYLNQQSKKNVLYSNGDFTSNMACALLNSSGYQHNITLKGGLNEWYAIVMNKEFKGGKLTARENALYENRARARKLFTQLNSLPDSLKNNYLAAKLLEEKELDGGCE